MCDIQWAHPELWWRAPLEVQGFVLSGSGVGGSMGMSFSDFSPRVSSQYYWDCFSLVVRDST